MPHLIPTKKESSRKQHLHPRLRDEAHKQALENMCSMDNMKNSSRVLSTQSVNETLMSEQSASMKDGVIISK